MKSKRFLIGIVALLAFVLTGAAYAITTVTVKPGQTLSADGALVQNNQATAPMKAAALTGTNVLTHGGTIGTFRMYTSGRWFSKVDWCVTTPAGVAVAVKRTLGNNTAHMPGNCGSIAVNREYSTFSLITFSNTSTTVANGSYLYTIDRQ